MGPEAQREYLARMRERYVVATRREKGRLLDEAVAVTGRHRKALIRSWRCERPSRRRRGGRPTRYGPPWCAPWRRSGRPPASVVRAAEGLLPAWLPGRGGACADAATEAGSAAISARQIDRVLAPQKAHDPRREYGRTKRALVEAPHSAQDRPLGRDVPGFTEMDMVAHPATGRTASSCSRST